MVSASGLRLLRALLPSGTEKTSQFEPPQQTIVSSLECVRYLPGVSLMAYTVWEHQFGVWNMVTNDSLKIVTVFVWSSWPSVTGGCLGAGSHLLLLKTLLESAVGTVL